MSEPTTVLANTPAPAAPAPVAAEPAAAPPAAPISFGPDEKWKEGLAPELLSDPTIKNVKTLSDAMKMLQHSQRAIGADKIVKPGKNTTDEEWGKIYDALGRPESPDKYDLKVPEGSKIDPEFHKAFKETLHKSGILPSQGQKMMDWYQGEVAKAEKAFADSQAKAQEEAVGSLKKEWGNAFETKIQKANAGLKLILDEAQANEIANDPVLANHPKFIRLAAKLGEMVSEDRNAGDKGAGLPRLHSPEEAQKEINRIMGDKAHPFMNNSNPSAHKQAVADMEKLFAQLHQ